jgi:hypothetical protein
VSGNVARGHQAREGIAEALVAHAEARAQGRTREARRGVVQRGEDRGVEVGGGRRGGVGTLPLASDDGQVQVALGADEGERDRLGRRSGAVLDGEHQVLAVAAQGEGGIDPGEEVAGAA